MMMKDEEDVAFEVVMHLASEGVDGIIVANNMSTDNTASRLQLASELAPCPVIVTDDNEPGYWQSQKMTHLAQFAAIEGAEWVIACDADELWACDAGPVAAALRDLPSSVDCIYSRIVNHYVTGLDDASVTNPFQRLEWHDPTPLPLGKVAFRWRSDAVIAQGNHGVRYGDCGIPGDALTSRNFEIRHFPYRSKEHFVRKAVNGAAAYAATSLDPSAGSHWRAYGQVIDEGGTEAGESWFNNAFYYEHPEMQLVHDPAPYRRYG
jgi:hypothetical protein